MKFDGEKIYLFMRELNREGNPRKYGETPMKLKDLARLTKIGYQTLWDIANTGIKNGVRKTPPNVEQALKIAETLKKKLENFIKKEENE